LTLIAHIAFIIDMYNYFNHLPVDSCLSLRQKNGRALDSEYNVPLHNFFLIAVGSNTYGVAVRYTTLIIIKLDSVKVFTAEYAQRDTQSRAGSPERSLRDNKNLHIAPSY
ncbi:hypothetical protein T01_14266, partial [Trichinella spiralis]